MLSAPSQAAPGPLVDQQLVFAERHGIVAVEGEHFFQQNSQTEDSATRSSSDAPLQQPRQPDGNGAVILSAELKQWHRVMLNLSGPFAHEKDNRPNPFTDLRMTVRFRHESGKTYVIPGYFAADGKAAHSSAESGTVWRASAAAGKPWIVAFDESGSAAHAQCPDLGYRGFDGRDRKGDMIYTQHRVRKPTCGVL